MKNSFVSLVTLVMLTFFAVSCGNYEHKVLSGIEVSTNNVDNDVVLKFSANMDIGAMSFPAVSLPILHPKGQTPIGSVEMLPVLGGLNQIRIEVNMSELAGLRPVVATLPNGNAIPLIANNHTIAIDLTKGARLYLTIAPSALAIGFAVPIKQFDSIGAHAGGVNFFPVVNLGKVVATAGLFTSPKVGQNGIAVVADLSRLLKPSELFPGAADTFQAEQSSKDMVSLSHASQKPSKKTQDKINDMLYKMSQKKTKLSLY